MDKDISEHYMEQPEYSFKQDNLDKFYIDWPIFICIITQDIMKTNSGTRMDQAILVGYSGISGNLLSLK